MGVKWFGTPRIGALPAAAGTAATIAGGVTFVVGTVLGSSLEKGRGMIPTPAQNSCNNCTKRYNGGPNSNGRIIRR